jgi:hypothetical protein
MVMMKRVTTYFNTAHLLQYINHNSKLLQNLVQHGGVLPSTSCCPHFVRIVVYSAAGVRPSFSQTQSFQLRVSARVSGVSCCCMRASVLKEFVLRASVLKDWRVACFPPFDAEECYRVSVLQSHQQATTVYQMIYGQNRDLFNVCAGAPLPFHIVHLLLHIAADT